MLNPTICARCGKTESTTRHVPKYHYRECGLDDVWLEGKGVIETTCKGCGGRFIAVLEEMQLLQVIAMDLLMQPGFLKGKEIRYLRETCELTQAQLTELLGKDRRPLISEWESQAVPTRDHAWEYYLRAVLMTEFLKLVERSEQRQLTKQHVKQLTSFARDFSRKFQRVLQPPVRLALVKPSKSADWQGTMAA